MDELTRVLDVSLKYRWLKNQGFQFIGNDLKIDCALNQTETKSLFQYSATRKSDKTCKDSVSKTKYVPQALQMPTVIRFYI